MRLHRLVIAAGSIELAACSTAPVPRVAKAVHFHVISSNGLQVYAPRFDMWDGHLDLRGIAYRIPGMTVPRNTHLDIYFHDAAGRDLAVATAPLYMPSLRSRFGPDQGKYRPHVQSLPPGTVEIEVRVHDGPHQASQGVSAPT